VPPIVLRVVSASEVEWVVAAIALRDALLQQLLNRRNRRVRRARWQVPHEDERAVWPQDADDLLQYTLVVEPMERFRREDGVDGSVRRAGSPGRPQPPPRRPDST
jgi:hypothetical protein